LCNNFNTIKNSFPSKRLISKYAPHHAKTSIKIIESLQCKKLESIAIGKNDKIITDGIRKDKMCKIIKIKEAIGDQ